MDLKDNGGKQLQLLGQLVLVWELCWHSITKHKLEKKVAALMPQRLNFLEW